MYSEKPKLHQHQRLYKPGNLRTISLDVTSKCNMNCPHCYASTFSNAKPIGLGILGKALDEAYRLGVFHYILQGGEPLVDTKRLEAILCMCHPNETYINIVSNGWEMTLDKILWLKDLQVDKICFSLDSGIEKEHDANRSPGSYKRVIEAIDNVLDHGLVTSISVVITHHSLYSQGFKKAYEYAKAKGIRLDLQIAEPVGKWDGKKEYLMTTEDSKYIKQLQLNSLTLASGQKMIKRDIFTNDIFDGQKDHCIAGTEFMALTAEGRLMPCNFLQFSLGNIRYKTISEMRNALLFCTWFDGDHSKCLCGEDEEFIDTYIMPFVEDPKPLNAYEVFNLASLNKHKGVDGGV